jgi:GH35 family endo-1,4-beta-xylanase
MRFLFSLAAMAAFAQTDLQPVFVYSGPTSGETAGLAEREGETWRLTTIAVPPNAPASTEWAMRIRARIQVPAQRNDLVLATFNIRCLAPEECSTRLNVEQAVSPYTKSYAQPVLSTAQWRAVKIAFRMAEPYQGNDYFVDFWMGQQVQTVEVSEIRLLNYGTTATPADVGVDPYYEGAADGAEWRKAAFERIDRLRKGDLKVIARDESGKPVEDAAVEVRMKRHAFGWGTAVAADQLLGTSADSQKYRDAILANFNMVVFENDLKWPQWEQNRQRPLDGIRWLKQNGISRIRGHNLVWPGWQYLPASLRTLENNTEALRARVRDHILEVTRATAGELEDWDVLNEPYTNRDLQRILGDEEMSAWFRFAQGGDPAAKLFINDYNILSAGGADLSHRNHYARTIGYLDSLGTPVDGIGMQGHFSSPTAPEQMLRILDRFATFNKPIEITEFDFDTTDEELQARFTRDLLITFFSHPSARAFLMWGFWEARHWRPRCAMIRRDWSTKPNFDVWREMVYKEWWTNVDLKSGKDGEAAARGFQGDYEVTVRAGDRSKTVTARLGAEGVIIEITLTP